nr:MAG TPA: DNA-directed RNA polymerase [Caudoviricetes sp.]
MTEYRCCGCGRTLRYQCLTALEYFPWCCRAPMLRKI